MVMGPNNVMNNIEMEALPRGKPDDGSKENRMNSENHFLAQNKKKSSQGYTRKHLIYIS
jgi:hypothetical protein